jgi:hypothetical protein
VVNAMQLDQIQVLFKMHNMAEKATKGKQNEKFKRLGKSLILDFKENRVLMPFYPHFY